MCFFANKIYCLTNELSHTLYLLSPTFHWWTQGICIMAGKSYMRIFSTDYYMYHQITYFFRDNDQLQSFRGR